jgi:hypothetical protein
MSRMRGPHFRRRYRASLMEGQSSANRPEPFDILPTRWVVAGAVATVVVAGAALLVLLLVAGSRPDLQIEAIKTGLSVGAGVGAVFALLLAVNQGVGRALGGHERALRT